jgi:hypothetical protein
MFECFGGTIHWRSDRRRFSGRRPKRAEAPQLQRLMIRAVQNASAPIFFFQAANDYDLAPSERLSTAMKEAGNMYEVKIYPPYGNSPQDGHVFGYFASAMWPEDVFRFLNQHCPQ